MKKSLIFAISFLCTTAILFGQTTTKTKTAESSVFIEFPTGKWMITGDQLGNDINAAAIKGHAYLQSVYDFKPGNQYVFF